MKAYGSVRTYHGCVVLRAYAGKARKFKLFVKNHKSFRASKIEF